MNNFKQPRNDRTQQPAQQPAQNPAGQRPARGWGNPDSPHQRQGFGRPNQGRGVPVSEPRQSSETGIGAAAEQKVDEIFGGRSEQVKKLINSNSQIKTVINNLTEGDMEKIKSIISNPDALKNLMKNPDVERLLSSIKIEK